MSVLPSPVSFQRRKNSRRYSALNYSSPQRRLLETLLTRARVTNLGLILLSSFATLSFLFNLRFYFITPSSTSLQPNYYIGTPDFEYTPELEPLGPPSISSTVTRSESIRRLDHLVIVPGHAIWMGAKLEERLDEDQWILEPYQRGGGRVQAFLAHIARGAEIAMNDERALLVFSGGQTRPSSATTEGESYHRLALLSGLLDSSDSFREVSSPSEPPLFPRATTDNYALDSFQNLLFSIARFHEYTGRYPSHITVVGYEMKRRRFVELHRRALRWPEVRFKYVGVDMERETGKAGEGELQNGYLPYQSDVYGCHAYLLSKRRTRNPFARFHSYYTSAPELRNLFDWCPGTNEGGKGSGWTAIFHGALPWDELR